MGFKISSIFKVFIEVIVKFVYNSDNAGVKKFRPIAVFILCLITVVLIFFFNPDALNSILSYLLTLL